MDSLTRLLTALRENPKLRAEASMMIQSRERTIAENRLRIAKMWQQEAQRAREERAYKEKGIIEPKVQEEGK